MSTSAAILVSRLRVSNFRCLDDIDLTLEATTTVLVGENNSGKTSVLLALATAIGRRSCSTDDLRRLADGKSVSSATIDIFISPPEGVTSFADDIRQRLVSVQRDPKTRAEVLGIRTTLRPSGEGALLSETRVFLQPVLEEWVEAPAPAFQPRVLDLIQAHLMDASRDLLLEMGNRTSAWGRVLSDLKIPDLANTSETELNPLGIRALERDLSEISRRVRKASPVLTQLHQDLGTLTRSQASVGAVDLVPLPLRVEELAKSMEVMLHQQNAVGLPLRFHGSGSRSLAALLVFRTMCTLKLGADQGLKPHLLTLLEEPEAHLHPHAIASLVSTIADLPGQRVVSTHSPTLVAEVPPTAVRLLRRQTAGVAVRQVAANTQKHIEHFRRFFGRPFGEIFFARLVVFGDGVSERNTLPILIEMGLGENAAGLGISFVDCKSMSNHKDMNPVIAALHSLGIPWLCYADNDESGKAALQKWIDPATGNPLGIAHPDVVMLTSTRQLEQLLVDAGYGDEITQVAQEIGVEANDDKERLKFLTKHKAWAPEAVASKARAAKRAAPHQMEPLFVGIMSRIAPAGSSAETGPPI